MNDLLASWMPLACLAILNVGLALSQYVVLRAGVFSVATPVFASLGAYTAALLALHAQVSGLAAILAGTAIGTCGGLLLALPLARLRGVFQAIATVAAVQINQSLVLFFADATGGPIGLNGLPRTVGPLGLAAFLVAAVALLSRLDRSPLGPSFDAIRQDEVVAVSLGISVVRHHALAFALSGALAGATGALMASYHYVVVPEEFGFGMLVTVLTFVVFGGTRSVTGPVIGAVVLTLLPEIARPFAENRLVIHGLLLVIVIVFFPLGVVDTLALAWRRRRGVAPSPKEASHAALGS